MTKTHRGTAEQKMALATQILDLVDSAYPASQYQQMQVEALMLALHAKAGTAFMIQLAGRIN